MGWGSHLQHENIHGPFKVKALAVVEIMVVVMEDEGGDIHRNNGDTGADGELWGRL